MSMVVSALAEIVIAISPVCEWIVGAPRTTRAAMRVCPSMVVSLPLGFPRRVLGLLDRIPALEGPRNARAARLRRSGTVPTVRRYGTLRWVSAGPPGATGRRWPGGCQDPVGASRPGGG